MSGKLYVCATPIGNLEDVTLRVLRILREVDWILAEDTRRTKKLLLHYQISRSMKCLEKNRERAMISWVIEQLNSGANLALVSDAGTPGLSDPGALLISVLFERGLEVDFLPGPSAIIAALVNSGLPMHSFLFHAFPPPRKAARQKLFRSLSSLKASLVFFESPHRIKESLLDMLEVWGNRRAAVCREMTKLHQEILRGKLSELNLHFQNRPVVKGEITVVIEGQCHDLTVKENG